MRMYSIPIQAAAPYGSVVRRRAGEGEPIDLAFSRYFMLLIDDESGPNVRGYR